MLDGASLLITGGSGSFGRKFIDTLLARYPGLARLIVFSRDEMKQYELLHDYPPAQYPQLRLLLGDVRDEKRLTEALDGVDYVVHAAALKHVMFAELNPLEFIKTNIGGAEHLINAALKRGVKRVVALSTDKAAGPANLYGATKLCSDKLLVAANNLRGSRDIRFSVVRYGNVLGSRGSVVPLFMEKRHSGVLPITHPEMTRFHISPERGIDLVLFALEQAWGGEVFVPRIPSFRLLDMAQAIAPSCTHQVIGIRPGERLHEEMITETDSLNVLEFRDHFVITPAVSQWDEDAYMKAFGGSRVAPGFCYTSQGNSQWLGVEDLRQEIRTHVDSAFQPL